MVKGKRGSQLGERKVSPIAMQVWQSKKLLYCMAMLETAVTNNAVSLRGRQLV